MAAPKVENLVLKEQAGYYAVASAVGKPYRCYGQVPDLATALKIARAVIDLGMEEAPIVYRVSGNGHQVRH